MIIRDGTKDDQLSIVDLIDAVYQEYGERIYLQGADSDLCDIETHYFSNNGHFWVLDDKSRIRGTHAAFASDASGTCIFRRLYLDSELRGSTDWGSKLMQITMDWAHDKGYQRIEFWSDIRFTRAHSFFEKFGFCTNGEIRSMHDGYEPYHEYFFWLDL